MGVGHELGLGHERCWAWLVGHGPVLGLAGGAWTGVGLGLGRRRGMQGIQGEPPPPPHTHRTLLACL